MKRALHLVFVLMALAGPGAALAQDRVEEKRQELEAIEKALGATEENRSAIETEIAALTEDRAALNRQLVDTAAKVQARETQVTGLEGRLEDLGIRRQDLREALRERRGVLAHLLAALQRMGQNPPPALLVHPSDTLAAIRSAIALGAVVPQMRGQAEALVADLEEMTEIAVSITRDKAALEAEATDLVRQQARLSLLMEIRRRQIETEQASLAELQKKSEQLAGKAETFNDLIASMEREIESFRSARAENAAAIAAAAEDGGAALTADQMRSYFASLPEEEEPKPVSSPKSATLLPRAGSGRRPRASVNGIAGVIRFGSLLATSGLTGFGDVSQGVSIATRPDAQIVAPCDGWIVYSGPFRTYRQLLIIDAGEGYHVVLAGMDRIDVGPGQFVVAGEPVGAMSGESQLVAASVLTDGFSQPVLYVEMRKDGQAIDPTPWWADRTIGQG